MKPFRRHHEKLLVIDNNCIIGSSNYQHVFGGPKYGSFEFIDMNYITKNINLQNFRKYFKLTADFENIRLDKGYSNEEKI